MTADVKVSLDQSIYALSIGYGVAVSRPGAGAPLFYDVLDDGSMKAALRRFRSRGLEGVCRQARAKARAALGEAAAATNDVGGSVIVRPSA